MRRGRLRTLARVAALVAVVLLLVVLPAVLVSLRTSDFEATVEMVPDSHPVLGRPANPVRKLRSLLASEHVSNNLSGAAGYVLDPKVAVDGASVARSGPILRLTARERSPERARDLANALAALAAGGSSLEARERAAQLLLLTRSVLERSDTRGRTRRLLRRRERALAAVAERPPERFVVARWAVARPLETRLDRAIGRLPGPTPPASHPLLTASAGLLVAVALIVVARWRGVTLR
jgi:hypothetical protein